MLRESRLMLRESSSKLFPSRANLRESSLNLKESRLNLKESWLKEKRSGLMGKKHHKKTIASLIARIAEHQQKIRLEYEKENPDPGLIVHWQKEICAFEKGIQQALKRLGKEYAD
jgi:hypothetical protein